MALCLHFYKTLSKTKYIVRINEPNDNSYGLHTYFSDEQY